MSLMDTSAWKPPRPRAELLPATVEQAAEYMTWFVNRRAYTRQTDRPDEKSRKYFFYQARDRQTKERLALDEQAVRKHLAGEQTIGLYAINPMTQCSKWVAIDADYDGAYRDLRTLKWELEQDGAAGLPHAPGVQTCPRRKAGHGPPSFTNHNHQPNRDSSYEWVRNRGQVMRI
jgi:hypothetical protein